MRIHATRATRRIHRSQAETETPSLRDRAFASQHTDAAESRIHNVRAGAHDLSTLGIGDGAGGGAPVQRRAGPARSGSGGGRSNSSSIPGLIRRKFERAFDTDFSGVRIHVDSKQADEVGAVAYTQGNSIHFRPRAFQPHSADGQKLIGHELAHIVQQREGRVAATTRVNGRPVNDSPALEREAEEQGARAVVGGSVGSKSGDGGPAAMGASMPMQGEWVTIQGDSKKSNLRRVKINGKDLYQRSSDKALFEEVSNSTTGVTVKPYVATPPKAATPSTGGYNFTKAVDDQYDDYKKKKPADWEKDIRSALISNANLSDDESDPDTDDEFNHHLASLDALFSVKQSASDPTLTKLEKTADNVKKELEDKKRAKKDNRLTRSTFHEVADAQTINERLRIPNNSVLRPAYRKAIGGVQNAGLAKSNNVFRSDGTYDPTKLTKKGKKLSVGEELYDTLRKKTGEAIPEVLEETHQKFKKAKYDKPKQKGRFKEELKKKPYYKEYQQTRSAKSAKLASAGGRSFALHHNHNKGGDDGFPEGALSAYNLTVENDERKGRGDVHQAHHRITSGYGGKSVNYAVYRHETGVAQIPAITAPSIKPKRKSPSTPQKGGPPKKKRKIDRL